MCCCIRQGHRILFGMFDPGSASGRLSCAAEYSPMSAIPILLYFTSSYCALDIRPNGFQAFLQKANVNIPI